MTRFESDSVSLNSGREIPANGGRLSLVRRDVREGIGQVARDTIATITTLLHDSGVLPEPERTFGEERLAAFEATILQRIPYIEQELDIRDSDFTFETPLACERHLYRKTVGSIGFTDGLHWIKLAAKEPNPGRHVDMERWTEGRVEDYVSLLVKGGLSQEAAQALNIGLNAHCRLLSEHSEWVDEPSATVPLAFSGDPMRC